MSESLKDDMSMAREAALWRALLEDCEGGGYPCLRDGLCDWLAAQGIDWRELFATPADPNA